MTWVIMREDQPRAFSCFRCGRSTSAKRFAQSTVYAGHRLCGSCIGTTANIPGMKKKPGVGGGH